MTAIYTLLKRLVLRRSEVGICNRLNYGGMAHNKPIGTQPARKAFEVFDTAPDLYMTAMKIQ